MTQRTRLLPALLLATTLLGGTAVAATRPPAAPQPVQEVITIARTAKTGLAALALIGKVQASKVPGFFASVDRYSSSGAVVNSVVDFNQNSGITRYGHGQEAPLCSTDIVCTLDTATGTLTFTITETDDADNPGSSWQGVTRYLSVRGTKIDLQVAAIGFTVQRHTSSTFARVTRDQADADGVGLDGTGAEAFRSAQLAGGRKGSFALLQLPCDFEGAGAVTFAATGDLIPSVVHCDPTQAELGGGIYVGPTGYGSQPGLYSRSSSATTEWQVNGLVTGLSDTSTRLFVLSY